jgi:hypothetical protein
MLLEDAEMDEDVALGLVADEEAEAAGGVEPFHRAGELDQRLVFGARGFVRALRFRRVAPSTEFPARFH